jgi:hypothetical protein
MSSSDEGSDCNNNEAKVQCEVTLVLMVVPHVGTATFVPAHVLVLMVVVHMTHAFVRACHVGRRLEQQMSIAICARMTHTNRTNSWLAPNIIRFSQIVIEIIEALVISFRFTLIFLYFHLDLTFSLICQCVHSILTNFKKTYHLPLLFLLKMTFLRAPKGVPHDWA